MNRRAGAVPLLMVLAVAARAADLPAPPAPRPGVEVIADLAGPPAEVAAAWRTQDAGAAPAEVVLAGDRPVLKLTCNFADTALPRGVWDHALDLDLTFATAISFDVHATGLTGLGSANLYLRSGPGWYGCSWYPAAEGQWSHVRLLKSHFTVDQPGAGWARIDGLRFSPWAGQRHDAVLHVANLGVERAAAPVLVLRQEFRDPAQRGEQANANRFVKLVADLLEAAGVPLPVVDSADLTAALLARTQLVLLPYASGLDPAVTTLLTDYLAAGGKLIGCFSAPAAVAEQLGFRFTGWRSAAFPGQFSSLRLVEGALPDLRRTVQQASWGLNQLEPLPGRATVAAWWHAADGARTASPALVLSERGAFFSHVILDDDPAGKQELLRGLVGHFCPAVLRSACERQIAAVGTSLGAPDFAAALQLVAAEPAYGTPAAAALAQARQHHAAAQAAFAAGDWSGAGRLAEQADRALTDAYCLAQTSQRPEFRATWCHPVGGVPGWTWDRTAAMLKQQGVDHLILNALHGASAGYPSRVAPTDATLPAGSDAFAQCVEACRQHGLQLHVWMTNYQPHGHAPRAFLEELRAAGRMQVDVHGAPSEQLCPSDDRNVALQRDMMVEAAQLDGVAGIHFDYIRYPDSSKCFCPTCRRKFEARVGHAIERWPQEVLAAGPLRQQWLQFRCDTITRLVREVVAEVRRVAPRCQISAAVFRNYPTCRDEVGQDWKLWVEEGLLDFVCPMNYTGSDAAFASQVRSQLAIVGGKIPCYPGIGLLEHRSAADAVRQIRLTRALRTGGFVLWSVYPQYLDTYQRLGLGVLK